ncbi:MAG: hypothetical protein KGR26_04245 [Cyanobacteria bacterium REEB65]|nr:hypothetical protein [Cyanobacteria bacterium REEB65]
MASKIARPYTRRHAVGKSASAASPEQLGRVSPIRARRANPLVRFFGALKNLEVLVIVLFGAQVVVYALTVAHEGHLDRIRIQLRSDAQRDVRLGVELTRLQSLDRVEQEARKLGFVNAEYLAYLPPPPPLPKRNRTPLLPQGAAAAY